jgi:ribosomal subunit interface protein
MNWNIQTTNCTISEEQREFVVEKLSDALRMLGSTNTDPVDVEVEVERMTNSKAGDDLFRTEVNLRVPGNFIRVEETGASVPESTLKARHTLMRATKRWREKIIDNRRKPARQPDEGNLAAE